MKVPVTLKQYAQLVEGINAEVAIHLSSAVSGVPNVASVAQRELEAGTIFGARNRSRQINVKSVLLPFKFESSNDLLVEVDRAIIVAGGIRLQWGVRDWMLDETFADNGVMTVCTSSLDEHALSAAASLIAEEIKGHLAFERMPCFA